jgi:hypothetical protein
MKPKKFPIALHLPKIVALLIVLARHIVQAISQSSWFQAPNPTPNPPLSSVTSHIDTLESCEATAKSRAKGAAAARDVARKVVEDDLSSLKSYVAGIVSMNIANAIAIIEAAGMTLKLQTPRHKPPLAVFMGASPGLIVVQAKAAGKGVAYEWQWSSDGMKTWTSMGVTNAAHTTFQGAAQGTTYTFRVRSTRKGVTSDWSQPVSLFVH